MIKSLMAASAAMAVAFTAVPASADTVKINYADLNLSTPAGRDVLERRIHSAARKLCGYRALRTGTRIVTADMQRCLAKAKDGAKQQMAAANAGQKLGG